MRFSKTQRLHLKHRTRIFIRYIFSLFFLFATNAVLAQTPPQGIGDKALDSLKRSGYRAGFTRDPQKIPSFIAILGTYVNGLLTLIGVLFMLLVMYGGFVWMTAAGDEGKIERAKKMVGGSIIGLGIILMARVITFFLLNAFEPAFQQ